MNTDFSEVCEISVHSPLSTNVTPEDVYAKTHTGYKEISERTHPLSRTARNVLILCNGCRSILEITLKISNRNADYIKRIVEDLILCDLISKVLIQAEEAQPDIAPEIVESYLKPRDDDPKTIICTDDQMAAEIEEAIELRAPIITPPTPLKEPAKTHEMMPLKAVSQELNNFITETELVEEFERTVAEIRSRNLPKTRRVTWWGTPNKTLGLRVRYAIGALRGELPDFMFTTDGIKQAIILLEQRIPNDLLDEERAVSRGIANELRKAAQTYLIKQGNNQARSKRGND